MKKILFTLIIAGSLIGGCDKNDTAQATKLKSTPNSNSVLEQERIDPIDCTTHRCPDSWERCAASCLYSSVCYCWDQNLYSGACNCTNFGTAIFILKVRPIPAASSGIDSPGKGVDFKIVLNSKNFEELLNFMESINIKTDKLHDIHWKIIKASIKIEKNEKLIVPVKEYEEFLKVYDSFIAALGENEKKTILDYIEKRSKEAGLY